MTWLVDFVGYSMRNAPSVRTSVEVLHTLQVRACHLYAVTKCV